ncbi:hypothetical protein ECA02_18310 [Enterococcus casseliflavus]|nr:hypothetical protein ECA02_18310 [Enterococcus casseliflavus]
MLALTSITLHEFFFWIKSTFSQRGEKIGIPLLIFLLNYPYNEISIKNSENYQSISISNENPSTKPLLSWDNCYLITEKIPFPQHKLTNYALKKYEALEYLMIFRVLLVFLFILGSSSTYFCQFPHIDYRNE